MGIRKYHRDVNKGDHLAKEITKRLNAAFDTLSDPVRRADYDNRLGISPHERWRSKERDKEEEQRRSAQEQQRREEEERRRRKDRRREEDRKRQQEERRRSEEQQRRNKTSIDLGSPEGLSRAPELLALVQ